MSLTLGQMTYNGVTLGPGGIAQIVDVQGLTGLPTVRSGDLPRPNDQGMLAGYDYTGNRPITLHLEVIATGSTSSAANLETLRQAFLPSTTTGGGMNPPSGQVLAFNFGQANGSVGLNRQVISRVRKFDDKVDLSFAAGSFANGLIPVDVLMDAVDPRIYDAVTQSGSVGLTVSAGGWTFPWSFPWTFTTSTGTTLTVANSGTYPCAPYFTITGPCVNPRVQNQTTGVTLQFNTTLNSGDTLAVDCYAGSAVLNGTAGRLNTLAAGSYVGSMLVQPGTNTFAFYSSDGIVTGAKFTLTWANTWL